MDEVDATVALLVGMWLAAGRGSPGLAARCEEACVAASELQSMGANEDDGCSVDALDDVKADELALVSSCELRAAWAMAVYSGCGLSVRS